MKKRADGRYLRQVYIGRRSDGKPKYKNIYGYSQAEVNNRAELLKAELACGTALIDDITLSDWSERWFLLYKSNSAINTQKMYQNIINNHIKPNLGHLKLKNIKPHHLQEVANKLISSNKCTIARQYKLTIKQILKSAEENSYIHKNVAEAIKLPKIERPKKRALSDKEKEYIKSANLSPKERAFVSLMLFTGLRRGEALALNFNDFDLENKTLNISKTIVYGENDALLKPMPKTEAGIRTLPLPDILIEDIAPLLTSLKSEEMLFTMSNGKAMSKSSFNKFWKSIIKKLQEVAKPEPLKSDITPHMFRHTYATSLYYAGVDIKTAQYLLGHSSIQMTLDVYTHLERLKNSNISEKLNSFFK